MNKKILLIFFSDMIKTPEIKDTINKAIVNISNPVNTALILSYLIRSSAVITINNNAKKEKTL